MGGSRVFPLLDIQVKLVVYLVMNHLLWAVHGEKDIFGGYISGEGK